MKQNKMQIPEGYKNSSLGIIPNDWEVKRLGDGIKELTAGVSVNSVEKKANEKEFGILKTSAVSKGKFYKNENKRIIDKDLSRAKVKPKKNNLIISRMNTPDLVGECGLITEDYTNLYLPDRLWQTVFQSSSCFTPQYINYLLNTNEYRRLIKDMATGTSDSMKNITKSDWLSLKVSIPPLPQQQKIAEILGTWDEAIEKQSKLIDKLTDRKRGLMQQLLTGKKRLAGFSEEWKEVRLGEILIESNELSKSPDVNRRLTVRLNLQGIEKREVRGTEIKEATVYYKRKAGQFIYGKQNLHKGALGIIPKQFDGFESSQDIPTFDFTDKIIPEYFIMFMCQKGYYESLETISTGTGSKRIQPKELLKKIIYHPPLPEQTAIANILTAADKEIELAKSKLELLRSQKSGLMQELLTGKTRVKI